jgi:hypothetical protein
MNYLLNEHKPKYDAWFKALLAIPVCMPLVMAVVLYASGSKEIWETFIVFIFILALIWFIMPRKFLVMSDRLRLIMGASLGTNILYSNIKEIRKPATWDLGVNYITSMKTPLEIVLKKGMNVSIAPEDRQLFLDDINRAMQEWRRSTNK